MAVSAWQLVCGLDAWRVTQIPRRPGRLPRVGTDDDGDLLSDGDLRPGPEQGPAAKAAELFAALFAEVRAYGEGLVVAKTITRWHHDGQHDTSRLHAVAWGQRPKAALASAIGAKAGEADWDERVASQLSHFTARYRWPPDHLTLPGPGHG